MQRNSINRRRKIWIDPPFQGRQLMNNLTIILLSLSFGALLPVIVGIWIFIPELGFTVPLALTVGGCFAIAVTTVLMIYYLTVRMSHRICGPVYRFKVALEQARQGQRPAPIVLRDEDELKDLAESFNDAFGVIFDGNGREMNVSIRRESAC